MFRSVCRFVFVVCVALVAAQSQSVDADINKSIRQEEAEHSQIMHTMHFFTDVYGPRLTGSPNHKAAAEWAIKQMKEWGFQNAHLEPWDFGHVGWMNEQASGYVVSPIHTQLTFRVLAWTPSTKGTIRAQVFQMIWPDKPTQQQLTDYLDSVKDQVKKKIVLAGKSQFVPVVIDVPPRRMDDKTAAERFDPKNPNAGQFGPRPPQTPPDPNVLTARQINEQIDQFLVSHGALLRINDAGMELGRIRAFNNRTFDLDKALPTV
ncbi:MAG TPA: peptidase M28, partial [Alphaproteobacteria bacterium]|nr:peptidase M28 [Alphaproteobacteria bacterium]